MIGKTEIKTYKEYVFPLLRFFLLVATPRRANHNAPTLETYLISLPYLTVTKSSEAQLKTHDPV